MPLDENEKLGRNAPCHCGSGKKYKKCCLRTDERAAIAEKLAEQAELAELAQQETQCREEQWEAEAWESLPEGPAAEPEESATEPAQEMQESESPMDRSYPKPPKPPKPDKAMAAFVDAWWERFMPAYEIQDLDAILKILKTTMDQHPETVPYLGLEDECLTDLVGAMIHAKRLVELVDFFSNLRSEFPDVYNQVYEYLDTALATSLIVLDRADEVTGLLDRFSKYPDVHPDCLAEMLDILLATNRQDDVFALARSTAVPCACSHNVMGLGPALQWLAFEAEIPVYERRTCSEQDAADMIAANSSLDLPFPHGANLKQAGRFLEDAFAPMDWDLPRNRQDRDLFLSRLCSRFWAWLHDTRGLSWATSMFFSNQLNDLYFDAPSGSATFREPLNPRKEAVERYIVQHCKRMFFTYGLQAFALLQALHWFADFLEDNGQGNDASREQLRETCRTLYKKLCETIHPTDDGLALFQTFPDYPFATSPGETP